MPHPIPRNHASGGLSIPTEPGRDTAIALHDFIDRLGPSIFAGLLTPEGIVLEANRSALEAAGLGLDDVLGQSFEHAYWWAHSDMVQEQLREAIRRGAEGQASRYDVEIRVAAELLIDVDFSLEPLRDQTGRVIALVVSGGVITGRQQTETALRESDARFRQLANHITDAFWIRSADLRQVIYVSPAFEQIWGRPVASLYADPQRWLEFTVPEDRERVGRVFASLTRDAVTIDLEYRIQRPDGEIRSVRARGFQVRDPDGALIRLIGIITDTTEKKRLEEQSLRAQRMESIGTLAGGIAHDLNNVLTPILMSLALLRELNSGDEAQSLLATLQESARHGADLVQQVLSFARGVEGQRIPLDPVGLMRELLSVMHRTFPKSIRVHFHPERHLRSVLGDPTQMHQVLLNLCVNARDAMPEGGDLTITEANVVLTANQPGLNADSHPGTYVMIAVSDTGGGIPQLIIDRMFEPFFTTKSHGKGTGLGLSTSLALVKSHGGFIDLESVVGAGTTFRVYLPASIIPAEPGMRLPGPVAVPQGHGELILLVDDEKAIRSVGKRIMERSGYQVILACDGAEALALYAVRGREIAAVVTDIAMPVMSGTDLIVALQGMNPAVRVVGCSGLPPEPGVPLAPGTARRFMPKPYTAEALLAALGEVLQSPA